MFGNSTVLHLLRVSVVLLAKEQTENHRTVRPAGVHHHFTGGNAPPNGEKDTPIETSMQKNSNRSSSLPPAQLHATSNKLAPSFRSLPRRTKHKTPKISSPYKREFQYHHGNDDNENDSDLFGAKDPKIHRGLRITTRATWNSYIGCPL